MVTIHTGKGKDDLWRRHIRSINEAPTALPSLLFDYRRKGLNNHQIKKSNMNLTDGLNLHYASVPGSWKESYMRVTVRLKQYIWADIAGTGWTKYISKRIFLPRTYRTLMKGEVEEMRVFYRGLHLTQTMRSKWRLTLGTVDLRNYPLSLPDWRPELRGSGFILVFFT